MSNRLTIYGRPYDKNNMSTILSIATFGAGCFWCVEAVFEQLDGVHAVESGYMGGEVLDPTYREICSGKSGHAEVTQIHYDPKIVSYETLLDWLWRSHDPTTLNRQAGRWQSRYWSSRVNRRDLGRPRLHRNVLGNAA